MILKFAPRGGIAKELGIKIMRKCYVLLELRFQFMKQFCFKNCLNNTVKKKKNHILKWGVVVQELEIARGGM